MNSPRLEGTFVNILAQGLTWDRYFGGWGGAPKRRVRNTCSELGMRLQWALGDMGLSWRLGRAVKRMWVRSQKPGSAKPFLCGLRQVSSPPGTFSLICKQ